MRSSRIPTVTACLCLLVAGFVAAQAPDTRETVAGATNYVRFDANFATAGVTSPDAFAALKKMGFCTVINLRTASEPGADPATEEKVVTAAGLRYVGLPFSLGTPDAAVVDNFLRIVKDRASLPVYIHCHSGQRANAFWLVKRVAVDGWTLEKALSEADALKLNPALRDFAVGYLAKHGTSAVVR